MLKNLFSKNYLLFLICILFLVTRLYKFADVPPSVYWDEASIGYNAYSVLQTGKDEWGDLFPIHFRAFGEFKLPVYIYSVIPFVKTFGLNEISVRLPAILFSFGVIIITYFLINKLTGNKEMGLWSTLFITTSPWFFIFSRTGYEATAGLLFYLLGIYTFLNLNKRFIIVVCALSFILSVYSYNSFRIITPLTIVILLFSQRHQIKILLKQKLLLFLVILLLFLSIIPIFRLYKYDAGISRLSAVGGSIKTFVPNYLSHFHPNYLFLNGDLNLRSQQGGFGQLNPLGLILLPLGFLYIFKKKELWFFIPLILLSPIPASITRESPHALRTISIVPFISIIMAMGVVEFARYIKVKFLLEIIILTSMLLFSAYYFIQFINVYPNTASKDWQYGYKVIFTKFNNEFKNYDQVIISDQYAQPYIFALFYLKYDSNIFRKEVTRNTVDQWGFSNVHSFNKFTFNKITQEIIPNGYSLVFATPQDQLPEKDKKDVISNLDGSVAFYIYEFNK